MSTLIETAVSRLSELEAYIPPSHIASLLLLLFVATVIDVRERRIPNWLVASGMVAALVFHGVSAQGQGALFALAGLAVGMATLLPLYALRVMGAGDVKLMGMIGAFLGMGGVLGVALASIAAGGVLALALALSKRMLPQLLANLRSMLVQYHFRHVTRGATGPVHPPASVGNMPYAVAITAGTLAQLTFLRY